jgi:hypothetical protein
VTALDQVTVTRYVTPLREGGSMPGVVEADDLGTYVCKFRGAGQGPRVLVAEVVVGELARRIGLRTPRQVVLDLSAEIARYEADEEVQDLLTASTVSTSASTSCPARSGSTATPARSPRSPDGSCGSTRSAPTSTGRGATPTCSCGATSCG